MKRLWITRTLCLNVKLDPDRLEEYGVTTILKNLFALTRQGFGGKLMEIPYVSATGGDGSVEPDRAESVRGKVILPEGMLEEGIGSD